MMTLLRAFARKRKPRDRLWSFLFTIVLSSSLIGGINYAHNNAGSSGDDVPSPSEMEFGQACDGPLFLAKLEANNARYKVAIWYLYHLVVVVFLRRAKQRLCWGKARIGD